MAQMIPDLPSPGTESAAELRMFAHLRDHTANSLTAFHHVAWLVPGTHGVRQGEADFVIADPRSGVVVVEVKGGGIRYDALGGTWSSVGRHGVHQITNPFEQARRSSFVLRDALVRAGGKPPTAWAIGHGVAFPDTVVRGSGLRLDAPRAIILDAEDLKAIDSRVRSLLQFWRRESRAEALGDSGVNVIRRVLANSFELRAPLAVTLAEDDRALLRLTEQQYRLLDVLSRQTRVAIAGCAGSGKTFLAVEKARRLAGQGFRVVLLCFNVLLADHLRRAVRSCPGVDAFSFFELCEKAVRERGHELLRDTDGQLDYNALFRSFGEVAAESSNTYDALVVDEGQDFRPEWWLPLQLLLSDPDKSPIYVFYDDNQRIFPVPKGLPILAEPMVLQLNCRNTQRIHRVVKEYYAGGAIEAAGPEGLPVEVTTYRTRRELHRLLDSGVKRWLQEAHLAPGDIALLTPHSLDSSVLSWSDTLGGAQLTEDPWDPNAIVRSSVFRFKGLERRVVAMVEIEEARDPLLYVGFSRASVYLSIFCKETSLAVLPVGLRRRARKGDDIAGPSRSRA